MLFWISKEVASPRLKPCFQFINRRNEMLLANKPTIVRIGTTGIGQEDEKIKRFATAIVEFGKVTRC